MARFSKKTSKTKINKTRGKATNKKTKAKVATSKRTSSRKKTAKSSLSKNYKVSKTGTMGAQTALKKENPVEVRLNKFLAMSGLCSRRKADEHIEEGVVKVNGKTVDELGYKVHTKNDSVTFKGKLVKPVKDYTYLVLFKPRNVITTLDDPHERPTIKDLIPKKYKKLSLFPIGRLDWQSEGLLILTNDGDYAQSILHPKQEVPKTYEVKIEGKLLSKDFAKLSTGVTIPGGKAKAVYTEIIKKSQNGTHTWVKLSVVEGRNRMIRKMFEKLGYSVMRLRRVQIGNLKISHLKAGDCVELSESRKNLVFGINKS